MFLKDLFMQQKKIKKKKSKTQKYCLKIQNFRRDKRRKFTQTDLKKNPEF